MTIMIENLTTAVIALFIFLFPLFYLQFTAESFEYNKMFFLFASVPVFFFLFVAKIIRLRRITLAKNPFTGIFFFLAGIAAISLFFQSPNYVISLTTPLSGATIIAGFLLSFFITNLIGPNTREKLFDILVLDAILISAYVALLYLGFFPKSAFTPAGTVFSTALFLTVISVYLINKIIGKFRKNLSVGEADEGSQSGFNLEIVAFLIIFGTTVFLAFHLLSDQKPVILPWFYGWPIFLEVIKNIRMLLLGIGPANFITAFTLTKPLIINQSAIANTIFTSSSSFFLTLATENGILNAFFYLLLLVLAVKKITLKNNPFILPLVTALILLLVFPGSMAVFILLVMLLTFADISPSGYSPDISGFGFLRFLLLVFPVSLMLAFLYFGGRAYLAEAYFKKSLDAQLNNDGTSTYKFQKNAIDLNSYIDRYHAAFSQTSLAMANAVAAKDKLTEEDKQNIPRLIQQSIDQARAAVILFKTNAVDWDNLARIYSSLTNFAAGSFDWAVYSYRQKIIIDPANPQNYLALGRLFYNAKNYLDAEAQFRLAVRLKPDLAQTQYFLGLALSAQQKYQEADAAFQSALSLVPKDSPDARAVNQELEKMKSLLQPKTAPPSTESNAANQAQSLEINQAAPSSFQNIQPLPTLVLSPPPQEQ